MGCCASKAAEETAVINFTSIDKETAGTAIAGAGTIGGAAVIGGVLAGPAAPIGAIIGAAVGAAIAKSTAGTVGRTVVAPVGVLTDMWRGLVNQREVLELLPDVGMLRTERAVYPPAMSELTSTNKYLYQIQPATIAGLKFHDALEGKPLTAEQRASLEKAVRSLEAQKVQAITGDTSALLHYQEEVQAMTRLPVLLSALQQAPLLAAVYSSQELILILTSDASVTSRPKIESALLRCGVAASDLPRFLLAGLEEIDGFKAADLASGGAAINPDATARQLGAIVGAYRQSHPGLRAVLMESTMLPMFSDYIRKELSLPVFDAVSLADLVHKSQTDNPRFGISFGGGGGPALRLQKEAMPAIGIMRIDYTYPPAMGDAAHPNSYYYRTPHATVKGLTFEYVQTGDPLTEAQKQAMASAVRELEAYPGLMGIAGDCGFLINYQAHAVTLPQRAPVFISAVLQCSLLASLFGSAAHVLVLTANGPELRDAMTKLLKLAHVPDKDHGRFIVAGCEDLPGFEAVKLAQKVDTDKVQPHVVDLVKKHMQQTPSIRAVLLECTELPPYADAVRQATGLVVMDVITLVDYFHAAVSENPHFGIDWERLAVTPVKPGSSSA